jgi:hypothetical protein
VDVGPSSVTKKAATVRSLTQLLQIIPKEDMNTVRALIYVTLANMEGEGLGPVNEWARLQAVREGVLKPTPEEEEQLGKEAAAKAAAPPDPQTQLVQAATEKENALATKAKVDTIKAGADVELARANQAKAEAEVKRIEAQTLDTLAKVGNENEDRRKLVFVDEPSRKL